MSLKRTKPFGAVEVSEQPPADLRQHLGSIVVTRLLDNKQHVRQVPAREAGVLLRRKRLGPVVRRCPHLRSRRPDEVVRKLGASTLAADLAPDGFLQGVVAGANGEDGAWIMGVVPP